MRVTICIDICLDMYAGMCVNTRADTSPVSCLRIDIHKKKEVYTICSDICTGMRTGNMCPNRRTGNCTGIVYR